MGLFDKVKEVAASAVDKAKDLAEDGQAKVKILTLETKIKDVYTEIGKAVVEAGGVLPEGGIAEFLEKINGFKAEIEAQKKLLETTPKEAAAAAEAAAEEVVEEVKEEVKAE